jgi:hypothetical protein
VLCLEHHNLIDSETSTYTVDRLVEMRARHITAVAAGSGTRSADSIERAAHLLGEFEVRAGLDGWESHISPLIRNDQPSLSQQANEQLIDVAAWLVGVDAPSEHRELTYALHNFGRVVQDLHTVFHRHAERLAFPDRVLFRTVKFYQGSDMYEEQRAAYHRHVALVTDLTFELTRAANHVRRIGRESIDPWFRLDGAARLIGQSALDDVWVRPEYGNNELGELYPGLAAFEFVRRSRAHHAAYEE